MNTRVNNFYLESGIKVSHTPKGLIALGVISLLVSGVVFGGYFSHTSSLQLVSFDMAASIAGAGLLTLVLSRLSERRRMIHLMAVVSLITAGLAAASWFFDYGINNGLAFSLMMGTGGLSMASLIMWKNTGLLTKEEIMEKLKHGPIEFQSPSEFAALHQWLHNETANIDRVDNKVEVKKWKDFLIALNNKPVICNGLVMILNTDLQLKHLDDMTFNPSFGVVDFTYSKKRKDRVIELDDEGDAQIDLMVLAYSQTHGVSSDQSESTFSGLLESSDLTLKMIMVDDRIVGGAFINNKNEIEVHFKLIHFVTLDVKSLVSSHLKPDPMDRIYQDEGLPDPFSFGGDSRASEIDSPPLEVDPTHQEPSESQSRTKLKPTKVPKVKPVSTQERILPKPAVKPIEDSLKVKKPKKKKAAAPTVNQPPKPAGRGRVKIEIIE